MIFLLSRRRRQNKVVAYNNPGPQPNGAYYNNNNQYQGGYQGGYQGNNDLPPQATPGYIPPAYPETSQQLGTYNSEEFSRPEGPPPAHTKGY